MQPKLRPSQTSTPTPDFCDYSNEARSKPMPGVAVGGGKSATKPKVVPAVGHGSTSARR
jgi:hypothetical protein